MVPELEPEQHLSMFDAYRGHNTSHLGPHVYHVCRLRCFVSWKIRRVSIHDKSCFYRPMGAGWTHKGLGTVYRAYKLAKLCSTTYATVPPGSLFLNGSFKVWIQIWASQKLFRWVRSHQVDLGQTWNGVKTRKSRRVMLILVSYVHVLRHLKKDFLNFSIFFKTA